MQGCRESGWNYCVSVLAIETATTVCAAAVVSGGRILAEASLREKYVHAERLMTQIDGVLRQSGIMLDRLDGIAVSIGPGSFTGLRIGLSVAKGLAFASGKRLVAVSTLQALAQRAIDEGFVEENASILAALDVRRNEVYCRWFKAIAGDANPASVECDTAVDWLFDDCPRGDVVMTGDALPKLQNAVSQRPMIHWSAVPENVAECSAGVVGRIGEVLLDGGEAADVRTLEPRYIKEFFLRQPS